MKLREAHPGVGSDPCGKEQPRKPRGRLIHKDANLHRDQICSSPPDPLTPQHAVLVYSYAVCGWGSTRTIGHRPGTPVAHTDQHRYA